MGVSANNNAYCARLYSAMKSCYEQSKNSKGGNQAQLCSKPIAGLIKTFSSLTIKDECGNTKIYYQDLNGDFVVITKNSDGEIVLCEVMNQKEAYKTLHLFLTSEDKEYQSEETNKNSVAPLEFYELSDNSIFYNTKM